MKFNNKFKKVMISLATVALSGAIFCSCSTNARGVASITKSGSVGLTDYYTITYTDGTYDTFTVTNGENGKDGISGANLDADALFEAYMERYPDADYDDFLKAVFDLSVDKNQTAVNKVLRSCLKVYTEFTESYRTWQGTVKETAVYTGSAVVYSIQDEYSYIITNYHVIYDVSASTESKIAKRITCYLYGSEDEPYSSGQKGADGCTVYEYGEYAIDCDYMGGCAAADIAVLKTETSALKAVNPDVKAVEFAEDYHVGQTAIAIGNPNSEGISVTEGIVSVDNEFIQLSVDGTTREYRSIRIDTALYGGNSGGGLFDTDGKLIGIANAGNGDDQNINYAVPLNIVKNVTESIIHYSKNGATSLSKITLGVTVRFNNSKFVYDAAKGYGKICEDVVINSITANSIAEDLGLSAEDIIRSIVVNQTEYAIDRYFDIDDLLYVVREGDEISVKYIRSGKQSQTGNYTVLASDLSVLV